MQQFILILIWGSINISSCLNDNKLKADSLHLSETDTTVYNGTRSKKEMRQYDVVVKPEGAITKKLKNTTKYSLDGLVLSETRACYDSNCCQDNKSFLLYENKNEYWYEYNRLVLRVFRMCSSLPSYKDFYEYKFDDKKRLTEEKELVFNYQTDNKKYEKGQWVPAKIGDSTLTEINIHQYTYNEYDSISGEKIIINNLYPDKEEKSWNTKYEYDKNRNLVLVEDPPFGATRIQKKLYYDDKNRVIKIEDNMSMEKIIIDIKYDENGTISNVREQIDDKIVTTKYQYNNNRVLVNEESEGNKAGQIRIRYFYNEFNDLVRKETSYRNEPAFIEEYEYSYYN